MRMAHWNQVDLNLLVPLVALLEERHVSRAAQRAHLSQPAMSRALGRLRDVLEDELLVRGRTGYSLTPRAERLQRQLAAVLPRLDLVFAAEDFDPASAAETFRLAGTDYPAAAFGAALFSRLFAASPRSTLSFSAWRSEVFEDVERGAVDLVFYGAAAPPHLRRRHLLTEPFLCVLSADHPLASRDRLELADYLDCAHVVVDVADGRQGAVERSLETAGASRTASLQMPYHFAAAPAVLGTHLVATLPQRLLAPYRDHPGLRLLSPPAEIVPMDYGMCWHPRLDDDPAQQWLRRTVHDTVSTLDDPAGGQGLPLPGA